MSKDTGSIHIRFPGTSGLGLWTLDCGLWTVDRGPWTVDFGLWTVDFGRWTLDVGLWTLDVGLWALDLGLRHHKLLVVIETFEDVVDVVHRFQATAEAELHHRIRRVLLRRLLQQPVRNVIPLLRVAAVLLC